MTRFQKRVKKRAMIRGWNRIDLIARDLRVYRWQVEEAIERLKRVHWVRKLVWERAGVVDRGRPRMKKVEKPHY